jgi:DNA-binding NarL/FixJ family response regulator
MVTETASDNQSATIRLLLIEDHRLVREGLKLLLERMPDLSLVGEAADGHSGLHLFADLAADDRVDVVVTDISLPDISGLEVTRRIKEFRPTARVVLLTMYDDDVHLRGMLETGADGYVLKQATSQDLASAVRSVMRGEPGLSPTIAHRLLTLVQHQNGHGECADLMNERERQMLRHLVAGATSKEIAQALGLSAKTVENYRARMLRKLGVTNTAAAIRLAYQRGLLASRA